MAWNEYISPAPVERTNVPSSAPDGKPTIAILVPHRGSWPAEYVERMWGPLKGQPLDWCNKFYFLCRVPSLPLARNTLVIEALNSGADYFLWVDADMIPEEPENPNDALRLLWEALTQTGEPIATGLYRAKQVHGFNYAIWKEMMRPDGSPGFQNIDGWPQNVNWFPVDVAGLGFCLMHRRVFEIMMAGGYGTREKPFFRWDTPDVMSEDFWFLRNARVDFNLMTWVYTGVKLSHMGELIVQTDGSVRVPRV